MNEKISDEKLNMIKDNRSASVMIDGEWVSIGQIVTALLAERAERAKNPGVWDGAPDDAEKANVMFYKTYPICGGSSIVSTGSLQFYTRELPKSRAREIADLVAEKIRQELSCMLTQNELRRVQAISESSILEYAASTK